MCLAVHFDQIPGKQACDANPGLFSGLRSIGYVFALAAVVVAVAMGAIQGSENDFQKSNSGVNASIIASVVASAFIAVVVSILDSTLKLLHVYVQPAMRRVHFGGHIVRTAHDCSLPFLPTYISLSLFAFPSFPSKLCLHSASNVFNRCTCGLFLSRSLALTLPLKLCIRYTTASRLLSHLLMRTHVLRCRLHSLRTVPTTLDFGRTPIQVRVSLPRCLLLKRKCHGLFNAMDSSMPWPLHCHGLCRVARCDTVLQWTMWETCGCAEGCSCGLVWEGGQRGGSGRILKVKAMLCAVRVPWCAVRVPCVCHVSLQAGFWSRWAWWHI